MADYRFLPPPNTQASVPLDWLSEDRPGENRIIPGVSINVVPAEKPNGDVFVRSGDTTTAISFGGELFVSEKAGVSFTKPDDMGNRKSPFLTDSPGNLWVNNNGGSYNFVLDAQTPDGAVNGTRVVTTSVAQVPQTPSDDPDGDAPDDGNGSDGGQNAPLGGPKPVLGSATSNAAISSIEDWDVTANRPDDWDLTGSSNAAQAININNGDGGVVGGASSQMDFRIISGTLQMISPTSPGSRAPFGGVNPLPDPYPNDGL